MTTPVKLSIRFGRIGHAPSESFDRTTDVIRIGSAENNDIQLPSKYVPAETAALSWRGEHWELFVLSETEVKIDDQPIQGGERIMISRSSELEIFPYILSLQLGDDESPAVSKSESRRVDPRIENFSVIGDLGQVDGVSQVFGNASGEIFVSRNQKMEKSVQKMSPTDMDKMIYELLGTAGNDQGGTLTLNDGATFTGIRKLAGGPSFTFTKPTEKLGWTNDTTAAMSLLTQYIGRRANIIVCAERSHSTIEFIRSLAKLIPDDKLVVAIATGKQGPLMEGGLVVSIDPGKGSISDALTTSLAMNGSYTMVADIDQDVTETISLAGLTGLRGLIAGIAAESPTCALAKLEYYLCQAGNVSSELANKMIYHTIDVVVSIGRIANRKTGITALMETASLDGELIKNTLFQHEAEKGLAATGASPAFNRQDKRRFHSRSKKKTSSS